MANEINLKADANAYKCEGIDCAYKQSCGRFMRPDAGATQQWASYYAIAGDDCEAHEPIVKAGV